MPGIGQFGSLQFGELGVEIIPVVGLTFINHDGTVTIEMIRLAFGDTLEDIDETIISNDFIVHDDAWAEYSNYNISFLSQPQSKVEAFKNFAYDEQGLIITLQVPGIASYRGLLDADSVEIVKVGRQIIGCPEKYDADISMNIFVVEEQLESPECN